MSVFWIFAFAIYTSRISAQESVDEDYVYAYFKCEDKGADFLVQHTTHICYTIHNGGKKSWEDARIFCETISGKLLKMTDWGFADVVFSGALTKKYEGRIRPKEYNKFWLAAKDDDSGTIRWTDGTPIDSKLWDMSSYVASIMKNFWRPRKLCVSLQEDGLEEDECTDEFGYICDHGTLPGVVKPEAKTTEEPNGLIVSLAARCEAIPNDGVFMRNRTCYTIQRYTKTWDNAKKACEELGGHLAAIKDSGLPKSFFKMSFDFRALLVPGIPVHKIEQYWIGAKDRGDGRFYWRDGSEVTGELWDLTSTITSGMIDLLIKRDMCLTMHREGYEKEACIKKMNYICEHDFASQESSENLAKPERVQEMETVTSVFGHLPTTANVRPSSPTTADVRPNLPTTANVRPNLPTTANVRPNLRSVPKRKKEQVTKRTGILTLVNINEVKGLTVPSVRVKTGSQIACYSMCLNNKSQYHIIGYNFKTRQCACYQRDGEEMPMEESARLHTIYYSLG